MTASSPQIQGKKHPDQRAAVTVVWRYGVEAERARQQQLADQIESLTTKLSILQVQRAAKHRRTAPRTVFYRYARECRAGRRPVAYDEDAVTELVVDGEGFMDQRILDDVPTGRAQIRC